MTKEEAIKILQNIVKHNEDEDAAIFMAIRALRDTSFLPSDLDEAAEKYANKEFPDEPSCGQWGTSDYEPPVDMEYPREIAKDSFKDGAEWLAGQGEVFDGFMSVKGKRSLIAIKGSSQNFKYGDNVIVQIRKK